MGAGCGCRMGFSPPFPPFSLPPVSPSISPFPSGVAVLADRDIRICLIIKTPNRLTACLAESESSKIPESSFPRRRESRAVCAETYPKSKKTETPPPSFPQKRESRDATRQEFIGKKPKPDGLDSRLRGNDGILSCGNLSGITAFACRRLADVLAGLVDWVGMAEMVGLVGLVG